MSYLSASAICLLPVRVCLLVCAVRASLQVPDQVKKRFAAAAAMAHEQSGRTSDPPFRQVQDDGDEEGHSKAQDEIFDSVGGGKGVYEDTHDQGLQNAVSYGEEGS